jgi:hypothetical protein
MLNKRTSLFLPLVVLLFAFFLGGINVNAAGKNVLKQGMSGSSIITLQKNLKFLGMFSTIPTGYFGTTTKASVIKFQQKYKLKADGIVGTQTSSKIAQALSNRTSKVSVSRSSKTNRSLLVPWFGEAENIFYIGATAKVIDIETGLSFNIKRSYGYNHADCETLTAKDTTIMKKIFGGQWDWERRAILVVTNGKKLAASMAGMPHAGQDKSSANKYISNRSGGYGRGENLDAVKGNNMNGVFDIHFYGSKTHGTNKVDSQHQKMVNIATTWAKNNL